MLNPTYPSPILSSIFVEYIIFVAQPHSIANSRALVFYIDLSYIIRSLQSSADNPNRHVRHLKRVRFPSI